MTLSVCLYFLSVVLLTVYILMEFNANIVMNIYTRMALLVSVCICWYNAGKIYASLFSGKKANRIMKLTLSVLLLLYVMLLLTLTLFDEFFGRSGFSAFEWDRELLVDYLEESFNFIPFATIFLYFKAIFNADISFGVFAVNIFGNIIAFMPFGFFLPLLIKPLREYGRFILIVLSAILMIELLQFVFLTGSCDIDDVLLNSLGASLAFMFFAKQKVRMQLRKIMYEP